VRISTKIIQEGLVLGLELLALHGCGWLTLKAKSLDQRREAALMTIPVCTGMGKLMHQNAKHPDRIVNDRRDQNLMGLVREALADQCSPTARFLADRALLLGKPQATRMLSGSG
jgi:hypothetical protein